MYWMAFIGQGVYDVFQDVSKQCFEAAQSVLDGKITGKILQFCDIL